MVREESLASPNRVRSFRLALADVYLYRRLSDSPFSLHFSTFFVYRCNGDTRRAFLRLPLFTSSAVSSCTRSSRFRSRSQSPSGSTTGSLSPTCPSRVSSSPRPSFHSNTRSDRSRSSNRSRTGRCHRNSWVLKTPRRFPRPNRARSFGGCLWLGSFRCFFRLGRWMWFSPLSSSYFFVCEILKTSLQISQHRKHIGTSRSWCLFWCFIQIICSIARVKSKCDVFYLFPRLKKRLKESVKCAQNNEEYICVHLHKNFHTSFCFFDCSYSAVIVVVFARARLLSLSLLCCVMRCFRSIDRSRRAESLQNVNTFLGKSLHCFQREKG